MGKTMHAEKFWKKVDKSAGPDGCWPWIGAKNKNGYGVTSVNYKQMGAHRAAYFFHHGHLPDGLFVCHRCDTPPCCNPAHFFLGDAKANAEDMVVKNRQSQGSKHSEAILPGRKRGENHYAHKLSEQQARDIIALRAGGKGLMEIAAMFSTPYSTIQKIVYRKTWTHLQGAEKPAAKRFSILGKEQVIEMRRLRTEERIPNKQLAVHFNVTLWTVNDIVYRRTWKHI